MSEALEEGAGMYVNRNPDLFVVFMIWTQYSLQMLNEYFQTETTGKF